MVMHLFILLLIHFAYRKETMKNSKPSLFRVVKSFEILYAFWLFVFTFTVISVPKRRDILWFHITLCVIQYLLHIQSYGVSSPWNQTHQKQQRGMYSDVIVALILLLHRAWEVGLCPGQRTIWCIINVSALNITKLINSYSAEGGGKSTGFKVGAI